MRYLIVVDMQKDFIDGSLGTKEAVAIYPNVVKKVNAFDGEVIFTKDTHFPDYLDSQEGKYLPVVHCVRDTEGWQLPEELQEYVDRTEARVFEKPTFGSVILSKVLFDEQENIDDITLIGLCTDICVVSNALMIKAHLPEIPVYVDASCCAGVTPQKHEAALETMRSCQIQVYNSLENEEKEED